ncbi:MAG: DUF4406 domain-containing protein [Bacteroidales bacterium]|nr:DUF4406 domain-containing protein [Bacteroidales bacterium]
METKDKIYLAGKVTGDPCYKMKFNAGVERLVELGWEREEIVNPAQEIPEETPWLKAMWKSLRLMRKCGWVALLPDWKESTGARIEHLVAKVTMKWIVKINI